MAQMSRLMDAMDEVPTGPATTYFYSEPAQDASASQTQATLAQSTPTSLAFQDNVQVNTPGAMTRNDLPFKLPLAGNILYGQMDSGANSDNPGPVVASIVQGELAGAKLVGQFTTTQDALVIEFDRISINKTINGRTINDTFPIQAVAVDTKHAGTGVATSVDRHMFERVALTFGTAFLAGWGDMIRTSGQTTYQTDNGVFYGNQNYSRKDIIRGATGNAAEEVGEIFNDLYRNKPTTIKVANGTPIGILFLE